MKKQLSLILTILLLNLSFSPTIFAQTKEEKETKFVQKLKESVNKMGTGLDSKVEVKLKDGTKLKGYVSEIKTDSFVIRDKNAKTYTEVAFTDVEKYKSRRPLSRGQNIALKIGIVVGLLALATVWMVNSDEW